MTVSIKAALLGAGIAVALAGAPAGAGEMDDLKAEIDSLRKQLERLEAAQKKMGMEKKAAPAKTVMGGDQAGSWKMPGSDTSISFSGYVKTDVAYDFGADQGDTFNAAGIALKGSRDGAKDGNIGFTARQSRIRFDSSTPTGWGGFKTRVETDFYGGGNALRLRHAYGQLGPVLAGQTWTLFQDEDTFADTVDFDGPVGVASTRKAQVRYGQSLGGGLTGQFGIEESSATVLQAGEQRSRVFGVDNNGTPNDETDDTAGITDSYSVGKASTRTRMPSFLAALRYRAGWGAANLSGVIQKVETDQASKLGRAVHLGAHVNVGKGTKLMATLNHSKGAQGYTLGEGAAAVQNAAGSLDLQESYGGFAGISHRVNDSVRVGSYFGWLEHDTSDLASPFVAATENKSLKTLHANLWWSPAPRVNIGLEVMHGWREANAQVGADRQIDPSKSTKGQETRVQTAFQYSF